MSVTFLTNEDEKKYVKSINGIKPDQKTGNVEIAIPDTSSYLTEDDLSGYATENFVAAKIAEAELSGSDVDLSGYATKDEIPKKTSQLTNDSGYITDYTETDPTVPSWAKEKTKPSYTKDEIGLGNVDNIKQYSANNPPPYPVTSVNGEVGEINLTAEKVGALPSNTKIPSKISELDNDSGFITGYTETDPTVPAWAKADKKPTYTASEVGALPSTTKIPSKLSDLTGDSTHRTVTDTEKSTWNAKVDTSSLTSAVNDALLQAKASGEFDGESGVYVGSGEMPEGYNVQIDPNGDADIEILTAEETKNLIEEEIVNNFQLITPQMFGAKADGTTDDTLAINAAINSLVDGSTLYFPDGVYLVKETDSTNNNDRIAIRIDNKQNITLHLSSHAILKHALSTNAFYRTIRINNSTNITIKGGYLIGDNDEHTPEYNSDGSIVNCHGYGIRVIDSSDITIDGVDVSKYYGDPIVLCSERNPYEGCKNVRILNCKLHDSLRNGITVTSCQGLLVKNTDMYNITGAMPMAGIDIEGEYKGAVNEDITLDGCNILNNGYQSIAVQLISNNVTIKNCHFDNLSMGDNAKNLVISDCIIEDYISASSNLIIKHSKINGLIPVNAKDVSVIGCVFTPKDNGTSNVNFQQTASDTVRFIGCEFMSPEVQDKLFINIRTSVGCNHLSFSNCTFHIDRSQNGDSIGSQAKKLELIACTFVDKNDSYTYQWVALNAVERLVVNSCIFDASNLTNYPSDFSSLVKIIAPNIIVQNCIIKTANTPPSTYGFHSQGDVVTGEVYYLNNTLPMYDSLRLPTTASRLVVRGNILSTDEIDTASLPSAEEASF